MDRRRARRAEDRTAPAVLARGRSEAALARLSDVLGPDAAAATLTALHRLQAQRDAALDRAPHPDRPAWAVDGWQYRDAGGDFVVDDWEARPRRARGADPAARWLSEYAADTLHDFPAAFL